MVFAWKAAGISYNRYLTVAARAVRRSLKEDKRIVAERRAETELKVSTWTDGKAGEAKTITQNS